MFISSVQQMRVWLLCWIKMPIFTISMFCSGTEHHITSLCPALGHRYALIIPGICEPALQDPRGKQIPGMNLCFLYEGWSKGSYSHAISVQPLGIEHATIPHMEAKDVPFHMGYGGLICSKGLLSDRPKCLRLLVEAGWMSLCKTVSKTMLEWDENRRSLSSLPTIWLFLWVGNTIIPHIK